VTIIKDATSPTYASGAPSSDTTTTTTSTTGTTTPTGTADTIPPTAAVTGPPSGTWTGNTLQVSMLGTDNVLVTRLELYANGQLANTLACSSATCSGTVTWYSGPLPSGQHTLTAVATDSSGNRTTSAPVTIYK
jgi:subtilase family serine protease